MTRSSCWLKAAVSVSILVAASWASATEPVRVYFFYSHGCPQCELQKEFLEEIRKTYGPLVEVMEYESAFNRQNMRLFDHVAKAHHTRVITYPTTFIGGSYWVGFRSQMEAEMEGRIVHCMGTECPDPGARVIPRELGILDALPDTPPEAAITKPTADRTQLPNEIPQEVRVISSTLWVFGAALGAASILVMIRRLKDSRRRPTPASCSRSAEKAR